MFNKKNGYQFQNLTVADASGSERHLCTRHYKIVMGKSEERGAGLKAVNKSGGGW